MRFEVLSSMGAQELDRSGNEVSDLDDAEFPWNYPDLKIDKVFPPSLNITFSITIFNDFEMGSTA